jgi:hypothetical protein
MLFAGAVSLAFFKVPDLPNEGIQLLNKEGVSRLTRLMPADKRN